MNSHATILNNRDFDPVAWADKIEGFRRYGKKEDVAHMLASISNKQRQLLKEPYKTKYGNDIVAALDKKFSGDLETLIFALMDTPVEYSVKQLRGAMKGLGTDENTLIEIICTRTSDQLGAIRDAYIKAYGKLLSNEIDSETSGEFSALLIYLVDSLRDVSQDTNDAAAHNDAVRLFGDGEDKSSAKERHSKFLEIFSRRNPKQLRKIFAEYERLSGIPIEKAINKEFKGDLAAAYLTIVRTFSDKQATFFAEQMHAAMKGLGTKDNNLIRAIVTRSEIDLALIQEEYLKLYNKSLAEAIKSETSGTYCDILLQILHGNKELA
ncbi:hypothetical protein WR25_24800 [Diploscapter pachys]|uniref:Annexin n=1 Tax=Diploscapter pachys TaxID=2018661 RepID=A0A2A2LE37_9BILA|nr:hypothetical protein WR25_24800 [Diploscapter pachys]